MNHKLRPSLFSVLISLSVSAAALSETPQSVRAEALNEAAAKEVDSLRELTQQMIDVIFSFREVGFQKFECFRYCVGIRNEGFGTWDECFELLRAGRLHA